MDMMRTSASAKLTQRKLPAEVLQLLPREREVARIVYESGAATARQVEDSLCVGISNAAVRSMLNRLVAKGILKRTLSYQAFVYLPSLTPSESSVRAIEQFAQDYFGGSLIDAAEAMRKLLKHRA
jgi:BlaI family transcriptional regulator, penicillinase repressor